MVRFRSHRRPSRSGRSGLWALILILAFPLLAVSARADLSLKWENVVTTPGGAGSADLVVHNPDSDVYTLSSFVVQVMLDGLTGVDFTGVSIATAGTYAFINPLSVFDPTGSPLTLDDFENTGFGASDSEWPVTLADPLYRTIGEGETYGLLHVAFARAAGAPTNQTGFLRVVVDSTSLADDDGSDLLAFTAEDGALSFRGGGAVVPEPTTIGGAVLAMLAGLAAVRLRRARSV